MGKLKERKERGYKAIALLVSQLSELQPKQGLIVVKDKRIVTSCFNQVKGGLALTAIDVLNDIIHENPKIREDLRQSRVFHVGAVSNEDAEWIAGEGIKQLIIIKHEVSIPDMPIT